MEENLTCISLEAACFAECRGYSYNRTSYLKKKICLDLLSVESELPLLRFLQLTQNVWVVNTTSVESLQKDSV